MITHEVAYYKNDDTTLICRVPNGVIPPVGASVMSFDRADGTTAINKTVATVVYDVRGAYKIATDTSPIMPGCTIVRVKLSA